MILKRKVILSSIIVLLLFFLQALYIFYASQAAVKAYKGPCVNMNNNSGEVDQRILRGIVLYKSNIKGINYTIASYIIEKDFKYVVPGVLKRPLYNYIYKINICHPRTPRPELHWPLAK
jgi:hypothetical protein